MGPKYINIYIYVGKIMKYSLFQQHYYRAQGVPDLRLMAAN